MKTRTERHYYANDYRHSRPYPNAAERSYYIEKLTDTLLGSAICVGLVVILFFLATM